MKKINDRHWYSIEKIIDELKEDQKNALTANATPTEIADMIYANSSAINDLKAVLEAWKEIFEYPNVSNLKYIFKH